MRNWKRLIYYLIINILVSACTILSVLVIWERVHTSQTPEMVAQATVPVQTTAELSAALQTVVALPTATSTPQTSPTPLLSVIEYQVQFNDTLGQIAEEYEVDIEELLKVNSLSDPNSLSVGQIIYIPTSPQAPLVTPEPTFTPGITRTPSGTLQPARVQISSVIGAGDVSTERVFLTRTGNGSLFLGGWELRDEDGNIFKFPELELYENGAVNVWTAAGSNSAVDLYWGMQSSVWRSGEQAKLFDAQGNEHASYRVP